MTARPDEEALAEELLPLVKRIAAGFSNRGAEYEDLIQVGCIGLVKAIRRWDPARGASLSTYAFSAAAGEIRHFLRASGPVKAGRRARETASAAAALADEARKRGEPPPRLSEISRALGRDESEIAAALAAFSPAVPLDADRLRTLCGDEAGGRRDEEAAEARVMAEELMALLPERERELMRLRFIEERTQAETGAALGISQGRVSRLERSIIMKLREYG